MDILRENIVKVIRNHPIVELIPGLDKRGRDVLAGQLADRIVAVVQTDSYDHTLISFREKEQVQKRRAAAMAMQAEGIPFRAIAKALGVSLNAVERYVRPHKPGSSTSASPPPTQKVA